MPPLTPGVHSPGGTLLHYLAETNVQGILDLLLQLLLGRRLDL